MLLSGSQLDPDSPVPLYRQLFSHIRDKILDGTLSAGAQLPATRTLAADLGLSRNTVEAGYRMLWAEGYLLGRRGSGTYVADVPLPHRVPRNAAVDPSSPGWSSHGTRLETMTYIELNRGPIPFSVGLPAVDLFPTELWRKVVGACLHRASMQSLSSGDPAGNLRLRSSIANWLSVSRGVRAKPEQIVILSSTQQAIDLVVRLVVNAGDPVGIEEPGYLGARGVFVAAGAQLVALPVGPEGADVKRIRPRESKVRLAYVTPSHQFPTGVTMSLSRRLELLDWAERSGAWVLEDDYDSEFTAPAGRPVESLQSLDGSGRVAYVGSFSKTMFPGLRLAFLAGPRSLIEPLVVSRGLIDRYPPTLTQDALADFFAAGHWDAHLRRMRSVYADRRDAVALAVDRYLAEWVRVEGSGSGLHLVGRVAHAATERAIVEAANQVGLVIEPLSKYFFKRARQHGVLFGFGAFGSELIDQSMARLATALARHRQLA